MQIISATKSHLSSSFSRTICLGLASLCVAMILPAAPCRAIQFDSGQELVPSDPGPFGWNDPSIGISGDFSIAGAQFHGDAGDPPTIPDTTNSGAAVIFEHQAGGEVVEHIIIPDDVARYDSFGSSAAISGNVAVIGSPFDEESPNSQNSGSAYVYRYDGASWALETKLIPDDIEASDNFGSSVAISGDVILVGSPKGFGRVDPGSVYLFRYDGSNWNEEDQITSSDAATDDDFGEFVALSGDTAVVGIPNGDATGDLGAVYIFRYDGASSWIEEDKLLAPADSALAPFGASFGESIAVAGDTLLLGAFRGYADPGERIGAVYVYGYDGGSSWVQEAKLTGAGGSSYNQHFGRSVALEGDIAVIGARGGFLSDYAGAAHAFQYDGASWVAQDTLVAPGTSAHDANVGRSVAISESTVLVGFTTTSVFLFRNVPDFEFTAADGIRFDRFGDSVATWGDLVLIGAPENEEGGVRSGSAYLYRYDGVNWADEDKFVGSADELFGSAVALEGDTAVMGAPQNEGAPGRAYVFRDVGATWNPDPPLIPIDSGDEDQFGTSVAISGGRIVVGAPNNGATSLEYGAGAAYVFAFGGTSWVQQARLIAFDGAIEDGFGISVAISGDNIVVGAEFEDENGIDAGAAYVFHHDGVAWMAGDKLVATDIEADDAFGRSVAISSDTIVVGAPRDDDNGNGAGAVYVFGYDGMDWVQETKLLASDGATVDRFGHSVAISAENTIVVGAEYDDMQGSAYVFWYDGRSWVEEPKLVAPVRSTDYFGASVSIFGDSVLVGAPYASDDEQGAAFLSSTTFVNIPEPSMLGLHMAALGTMAWVARRRLARRVGQEAR